MLANFRNFVKTKYSDIVLTAFIVLLTLISFGLGRLTVRQQHNQPIIIQNPTASVQQATQTIKEPTKQQGVFVGSLHSNKYHWPDCPWAKKIAEQNQIWFSSEQEAQTAGYTRCRNFEQYAPK